MAFEQPLLISIKNVDLQTGLFILENLSKDLSVKCILIKRVWDTSHSPLNEGGQIEDLKALRFEGGV
jgi:hypothetical protein